MAEWEETRFTFSTLNFKFSSTFVESSLQIILFLQNEPKFRKVKFNVTKVLTKDYDKIDTWSIGKTNYVPTVVEGW